MKKYITAVDRKKNLDREDASHKSQQMETNVLGDQWASHQLVYPMSLELGSGGAGAHKSPGEEEGLRILRLSA